MSSKEEVLHYENYDLDTIQTPVKADRLIQLIRDSKYDTKEIEFLEEGFKQGFDIGYESPEIRQSESNNIPLRVGSKTELWNKIMKEVKTKRLAGPFKKIPFKNYIQSPIGLVPKSGKDQTRLIFHLSYDFVKDAKDPKDKSMNANTPKERCSVKYQDLDHPVRAFLRVSDQTASEAATASGLVENSEAVGCAKKQSYGRTTQKPVYAGKSDLKSAFHLLPLSHSSYKWVVMKAQNPETLEWFYFMDKCLPFGVSISCSHFQRFSNELKYLAEHRNKQHDG